MRLSTRCGFLAFLMSCAPATGVVAGTDGERAFGFDSDPAGRPPAGWSLRETNPSEALAVWRVEPDESAPSPPNVLALAETRNYGSTFNLAIAEGTSYADLDLSVHVKPVSGSEDQGGGPIWRCRDENNYYVARFNPLESNFRVYKVEKGRRRQLESARVDTQPGVWYTLRVTMVGERISCYLDGEKLLETTDGTFREPGMIGLWTKADAATSFDDLRVRSAPQ